MELTLEILQALERHIRTMGEREHISVRIFLAEAADRVSDASLCVNRAISASQT